MHLCEELAWCNADAARRRSTSSSPTFSFETRLEHLNAAQLALDKVHELLASNKWVLATEQWVTPAKDLNQLQDTIRRRRQANLRSPDKRPIEDARVAGPFSVETRARHAVSPDIGVRRDEFSV